jgi:organic radical activating enzyme
MFKTNRPVAAEIFSSGVCNIKCNYCYIPKVSEMKNIHKQIIDKIKNDKFVSSLKDLYGDDLEHLSFWGTEPTLTFSHLAPKMNDILDTFPKLTGLSWSSNFITDSKVTIDFIDQIKPDRDIDIKVQVSLDGPTEITDSNRAPGATKKIITNVMKFLDQLDSLDLTNKTITLTSKPTWGVENISYYNSDINNLYDYFYFFDELLGVIKEHAPQTPQFNNHFGALSSLVVPGKYTKQDGLNLTSLFHKLYQIEEKNDKQKLFKHIHGPLNTYEIRLRRLLDYGLELGNKPEMFTCSGGDSNWAIDERDQLHICHRSLFLNNQKYVNEVMAGNEAKDWGVSEFDRGTINAINRYIVDSKDEYEVNRFNRTMSGYHTNTRLRDGYVVASIKELALANQADSEFLYNEDLTHFYAAFMNSAHSCPMENVIITGNVHLVSNSMLKVFGNGAFQLLIKKLSERINK